MKPPISPMREASSKTTSIKTKNRDEFEGESFQEKKDFTLFESTLLDLINTNSDARVEFENTSDLTIGQLPSLACSDQPRVVEQLISQKDTKFGHFNNNEVYEIQPKTTERDLLGLDEDLQMTTFTDIGDLTAFNFQNLCHVDSTYQPSDNSAIE